MKKYFLGCMALLLVLFSTNWAIAGTLYDDGEIVIDSSNLYPKTDGGSTLGKSGNEFAGLYVDSITLGGSAVTSWGSVISPWEESAGTTFLTSAPTKFILTHSSGNMDVTGTGHFAILGTTGNVGIGITTPTVRLDIHSSGTGASTAIKLTDYDGVYRAKWLSNGNLGIGVTTPAASLEVRGAGSDSGFSLKVLNLYDTDTFTVVDNGNVGIGNTAPSQKLYVNGNIQGTTGILTTLQLSNSENISNGTNGTVQVSTNSTDPILSVYDPGTSDSDATIQLISDAAGDNGDTWQIQADGGTQDLLFRNNTTGSLATILTIGDSTGLVTTTGDVTVAGTTPLVTIGDNGDEDATLQFNENTQDFYVAVDDAIDDLVIGLGSTVGTTPAIDIDSSGNVALGSTAPAAKLDVRADGSGTNLTLRLLNTASRENFVVLDNGNVGMGMSNPSARLMIQSAGSNTGHTIFVKDQLGTGKFALLDNGNVGIGYTAPSAKLQVRPANTSAADSILIEDGDGTDKIEILNNGNIVLTNSARLGVGLTNPAHQVNIKTADTSATVGLLFEDGDGTDKVELLNNGNVALTNSAKLGIGITAPETYLNVRAADTSASVAVLIEDGDGTNKVEFLNNGKVGFYSNVGIGTTAPGSVFTINASNSGPAANLNIVAAGTGVALRPGIFLYNESGVRYKLEVIGATITASQI